MDAFLPPLLCLVPRGLCVRLCALALLVRNLRELNPTLLEGRRRERVEVSELHLEDEREEWAPERDEERDETRVLNLRQATLSPHKPRGRVEKVDDKVGGDAGEALDGGGPREALVVIARECSRDLLAALELGKEVGEYVCILHRLAAALPQVGHHWMARVAEERHAAAAPRLEHRGGSVIEVALLDGIVCRLGERLVDCLCLTATANVTIIEAERGVHLLHNMVGHPPVKLQRVHALDDIGTALVIPTKLMLMVQLGGDLVPSAPDLCSGQGEMRPCKARRRRVEYSPPVAARR